MMHQFHVGQKVVCVDAAIERLFPEERLTEGAIYTIRWIGDYPEPQREDLMTRGEAISSPCVRLLEIVRPLVKGEEPAYRAVRFRPLIQTDISIFTAMLAPTPVTQRENEDA